MTARKILALCKERGLTVYLGKDGEPRIKGPPKERTEILLANLKRLRCEIIVALGGTVQPQAREVVPDPPTPEPIPQPQAREVGTVERIVKSDGSVIAIFSNPTAAEMHRVLKRAMSQGIAFRALNWEYREGSGPWQVHDREDWYPFMGLGESG